MALFSVVDRRKPSIKFSYWSNPLKLVATLAFVGLISSSLVTSASAANRKVDIINDTGKTMVEFYASNTGTKDWEEDILGRDTLEPGEEFEADINDGTGACVFDFKAVFSDGSSRVREDVDVCKISKFTYR